MPKCSIDGCNKPVHGWGWCSKHYCRWKKYGDTSFTKYGHILPFLDQVLCSDPSDSCIKWPFSTDMNGYGHVWVDGKINLVTRVICFRKYGPPPTPKHEVAHSCGKGHEGCCNPYHLRWATRKENQADRIAHGTTNRGVNSSRAKLNECDVRNIRIEYAKGGVTQQALADFFDVPNQSISLIISRKQWAHVL